MAFELDFPQDFLSDLLDVEFEDVANEALEKAAPILEKSMKAECKKVIEHDGDSEMMESIKAGKPKRTKTDACIINVTPKGYSRNKTFKKKKSGRKYPVSNALKMIWKEYGIEGQQPARPFIQRAVNNAREDVMKTMQEAYNRKVKAK